MPQTAFARYRATEKPNSTAWNYPISLPVSLLAVHIALPLCLHSSKLPPFLVTHLQPHDLAGRLRLILPLDITDGRLRNSLPTLPLAHCLRLLFTAHLRTPYLRPLLLVCRRRGGLIRWLSRATLQVRPSRGEEVEPAAALLKQETSSLAGPVSVSGGERSLWRTQRTQAYSSRQPIERLRLMEGRGDDLQIRVDVNPSLPGVSDVIHRPHHDFGIFFLYEY